MSVLQTWLLYKNAISSGVAIDDILKYARRTKDDAHQNDPRDEGMAAIVELRRQVAAQDAIIKELLHDRKVGEAQPLDPLPTLVETSKGNNLPRASSRVHFEETASAATASSPNFGGQVPVRRAFATSSASRISDMEHPPPAPPAEPVSNSPSRVLSSPEVPIAQPSTPERSESATSKRPLTPHSVLKAKDASGSVSLTEPDSAAPEHVSAPVFPGVLGDQGNDSFPVRSKTKKGRRKSGGKGSNLGDLGVAGLPSALSNPGEFVFKVPDTLPPRVKDHRVEE